MADELPPGTPEVDDPLLVADLIRLLSIKGAIGRLPLADIVIPVVSLGDVVTPQIDVRQPSFRSTDVFSAGILTAPAANTVLADTTALTAGVYDVHFTCSGENTAANAASVRFEHRNAANAANLAQWDHLIRSDGNAVLVSIWPFYSFGYVLGEDERLRAIITVALAASRVVSATIFARRRT